MTVINTNIKSLISQNAIVKNNRDLSTAMQQLSTGKRVNSAKDDAAGLAITSRMTAQIRGLDQAIRNGNDSVSMLQTTEGAMIEMTNMLQRMRELAIQAANDTYTPEDRRYLDLEFQQLKTEVNRITRDTQWNGMDVLNGTFTNDAGQIGRFRFQVGGNEGQVITHTIPPMGFKESTGAASFTTPTAYNATGPVAQVSNLALSGDFSVGDTITVKIVMGSTTTEKTYAVSGNDLISGDTDQSLKAIADNMATQFASEFPGITITSSNATDGLLEFKSDPAAAFTPTRTLAFVNDGGELSNIEPLDITSNTNSNLAIAELDVAINKINEERAGIGAVINRLTYAVDNLANVSQNTTESRSRILDTDYAKASSELARTQIIAQAATAMLAQANQSPQTVLQLLQG